LRADGSFRRGTECLRSECLHATSLRGDTAGVVNAGRKSVHGRLLRRNAPRWARPVPARNPPPHRRREGSSGRLATPRSKRLVSGRFSAVAPAWFSQPSTAAILTVIGFVSAGLLTFSQAIGVIMGATLGTTSTPRLVAIFGFRVRIAAAALPILGVGALLWSAAASRCDARRRRIPFSA